jgi:PAS domain S-box-containing protein
MRRFSFLQAVDRSDGSVAPAAWSPRQAALAAVLVAVGYLAGAALGLSLTFRPSPVSALWPPNAVLLAALLLAPTRSWFVVLLAALPVHVFVELQGGVPLPMIACWFVSNCSEALIGAVIMRRLSPPPARLDTLRALSVFMLIAAPLAAFLSSFLDAAFVALNHWGAVGYWNETIVPVILGVVAYLRDGRRKVEPYRIAEAAGLALSILVVCLVAFVYPETVWRSNATMLYTPLPLLVWAAVRFGTAEVSFCIGTVAFFAVWGAAHGHGPFTALSAADNALSVQLFLILISVPLAILAALMVERKRAVETLEDSRRITDLTIAAAHIGMWGLDLETSEVTFDDSVRSLLGLTTREAERYTELIRRIHPADVTRVLENQRAALAPDASRDERGDSPMAEIEYRVCLADGSVRWLLTRGTVLRRPDGTPDRITGTVIDITHRRRAEHAHRESEERVALAAAAANIGFWSCELNTLRVWATDECHRIAGIPPRPNLTARACLDVVHPDDRARAKSMFELACGAGILVEMELRVVRPDGDVRSVALTGRTERVGIGSDVRMIGSAMDVTARRRAEWEVGEQRRELAHLSRVVTLGELSGALAHEMGQPLTAIMSNAQAALRILEKENFDRGMIREILTDIVHEDRRAGDVIRQLRQLFKKTGSSREPVDPRDAVNEALSLAHSDLIAHNISVVANLPREPLSVLGDHVQLQQVLLNLILNARDAMAPLRFGKRQLGIDASLSGGRVRISVSDSGPGIPPHLLEQIFEPFFTTKQQGLGLGLSICRSIIAEHGGELWAENGSVGAVFIMQLPAREAAVVAGDARAVEPRPRIVMRSRRDTANLNEPGPPA